MAPIPFSLPLSLLRRSWGVSQPLWVLLGPLAANILARGTYHVSIFQEGEEIMIDPCLNAVRIVGSPEQIDELRVLMKDSFNFGNLIPIPDALYGIGQVVDPQTGERFLNRLVVVGGAWVEIPVSSEESASLERRYGTVFPDDWAKKNWGTPTSASETRTKRVSSTELRYEFKTYGRPPSGVSRRLRERFPTLEIEWIWGWEMPSLDGPWRVAPQES
jgi:hypothetical protein